MCLGISKPGLLSEQITPVAEARCQEWVATRCVGLRLAHPVQLTLPCFIIRPRIRGVPAMERLTQLYLQPAPEYQAQLKHVGLLREVPPTVCRRPRLPSIDEGIDLIACTRHGADIRGKSRCGRNLQLLAEIWKNCVWGWTDTAASVQNRRLS